MGSLSPLLRDAVLYIPGKRIDVRVRVADVLGGVSHVLRDGLAELGGHERVHHVDARGDTGGRPDVPVRDPARVAHPGYLGALRRGLVAFVLVVYTHILD